MSIIENKQLLRTSHDVVKLLRDQNIALRKENKALLERVSALEAKLGFLAGKKNLLLGLKGERLVSELVEGQLTSHTSGFDVVSASGYVFECKYSSLGIADRSKKNPSKRWAWPRPFGTAGKKFYDYIILIGDADDRWSNQYKDKESPYIIFCVPYEEVESLTITTDGGRMKSIHLTSNPSTALRSKGSRLFREFQITAEEFEQKFADD